MPCGRTPIPYFIDCDYFRESSESRRNRAIQSCVGCLRQTTRQADIPIIVLPWHPAISRHNDKKAHFQRGSWFRRRRRHWDRPRGRIGRRHCCHRRTNATSYSLGYEGCNRAARLRRFERASELSQVSTPCDVIDVRQSNRIKTQCLCDRAVEVGPSDGFRIANEECLAIDSGCREGELNRVHEVVDVEAVADSAAIVQPTSGPGQEFGGEARLPDGSWPCDNPRSKYNKLNRAPGAQVDQPALCPHLRVLYAIGWRLLEGFHRRCQEAAPARGLKRC